MLVVTVATAVTCRFEETEVVLLRVRTTFDW